MEKISLPFTLDVEMKMYHNKSFPLGIIKANIKDYDSWLCNKLINCICRPNYSFDCIEEDIWSMGDGLTFFQGMRLTPETFSVNGFNLIEFNKSMLSKGFYITGTYNEFYIPQKMPYKKADFNHDYVLFGYDDEKKVFKSAAYLDNEIYSYFEIGYENYYYGVTKNIAVKSSLQFYYVDKNYLSKIDICSIKNKLHSYLYSNQDDHGNFYGIAAWDKLSEYVLENDELDPRYSRAYMEHRLCMLKRIYKLQESSYIYDEVLGKEYMNDVYTKAQCIHNMFLKYNLTRNKNLLLRISNLIKEINKKEFILIEKMLKSIKE